MCDTEATTLDRIVAEAVAVCQAAEREQCCRDACPWCASRHHGNAQVVGEPQAVGGEWQHQITREQPGYWSTCYAGSIRERAARDGGAKPTGTDIKTE